MAVKIGHASIDENGRATGGKAGNQTTKEVCFSTWWNDGWTALVRPSKKSVANKIVKACKAGVNNKKIGYDQSQRTTLFIQAEKVDFDLSKVSTVCETDCSAFVSVCVNAAGVKVSKDIYTGNMVKALEATGAFKVYRGTKYLTSSDYLKAGDILVAEGKHTIIILEDGAKISNTTESTTTTSKTEGSSVAEKFSKSIAGTYKTTNALNLRAGAGTNHKVLHVIPKGDKVVNYGYYSNANGVRWLYVVHKGAVGFVSSNYVRKV